MAIIDDLKTLRVYPLDIRRRLGAALAYALDASRTKYSASRDLASVRMGADCELCPAAPVVDWVRARTRKTGAN